jgi:glycosyltransferase involved in cell wall biosynthesis
MKRKLLFIHITGHPIFKNNDIVFSEGGLAHVYNVASELKNDYKVTIICPGNGKKETIVFNGVKFLMAGRTVWINKSWFEGYMVGDIEFFKKFRSMIKEADPDVMLGNTPMLNLILPLLKRKTAKIAIVHDLFFLSQQKKALPVQYSIEKTSVRLARFINMDGIAAINSDIRNAFLKRKFKPSRVITVGNGVNPKKYVFKHEKEGNNICFIGRLSKSKRAEQLLDVVVMLKSRFPDIKLTIIGDGASKQDILNKINKKKLGEWVTVKSKVTESEKISILSKCKVYVSLSKTEGFGIPIVEAMACGAVPVISNISAHQFVFQDELVGYLVRNKYGMASKVVKLLKNEEERIFLAKNGRVLVETKWNWKETTRKYDILIKNVLSYKTNKESIIKKSKNLVVRSTRKGKSLIVNGKQKIPEHYKKMKGIKRVKVRIKK